MAKQKSYIVQGIVTNKEGIPVKDLLIRATDDDPNTPEDLLGTPVLTDDEGFYKIEYTDEHFRPGGRESGGAEF